MELGDLIDYEDRRWFIRKVSDATNSATAVSASGELAVIPFEAPHQVVAATRAWPFVVAKKSPFILVIERHHLRRRSEDLQPLVDWVQPEPGQTNGSVFFNPGLRLKFGDVLIAKLRGGGTVRITIPRNFGTMAQRLAKAPKKVVKEDRTAFDRLLEEDDYE